MDAFPEASIAQTIADLPRKSSRQLEALLDRAKSHKIAYLQQAVEAELEMRGSAYLDDQDARQHHDWHVESADLDLTTTMATAFLRVPPVAYELPLIKAIAANPGISHQALESLHGKGDVGLILGNLVYDRLGFFRRFLVDGARMSDLVLIRNMTADGKMSYILSPEARSAFLTIGVLRSN